MSLLTRVITAFTVLSAAAIPVAALTIKNTSDKDVTIGVHNGTDQAVYTVPARGSVDVKEDCSSDCAVTGPWGFSRLVSQNATIETDGLPLVTVQETPSTRLVSQQPATETAEVAPEPAPPAATAAETPAPTATEAPAAKPVKAAPTRKRAAKPRRPAKQAKAKKGPAAGSFQMLFQGPGK